MNAALKLDQRLVKLAASLDNLAAKDARLIEEMKRVELARRTAALELHATCGSFVQRVNQLVTSITLELSPPAYTRDSFRDGAVNLLQINARGRLIQMEFTAPEAPRAMDDFRQPYILHGKARCYNQEQLDSLHVLEHSLYFCEDKKGSRWLAHDVRTGRTVPVDHEYLTSLMERIV